MRPYSIAAALAAVGMLATGCSLLGGDGDPATGASESTTEIPDSSLTATTSANSASANSGSDSSESSEASDTTGTTEASTFTTESLASSSTLAPVFQTGFCDAPPQNRFEITFDPGSSFDVVDSAALPGQVDLYEIEVGDDQIMSITLDSVDPNAVATLFQPDATTAVGAFVDTTVAPTMAGSYWICVTSGEVGSDYQLSVSVIDDSTPTKIVAPWCGADVNDRGEIQFESGRFSGEVENAVIRGERDLYTLTADEGQALDLFLVSPEFNAVFALRTPSAEILIDEVSDFRIPLPESGTYEICIGGTRGNASYVLDISIG